MWIARAIPDLAQIDPPRHLAIGTFDGLHIGHASVIAAALDAARRRGGTAVLLSFDPHPRALLRPGHPPALLTPQPIKHRILERLGISHHLLLPFTHALAETPPEIFIESLADTAHPIATIAVGEAWSFGRHRAGNVALLRRLAPRFGFQVRALPPVLHGGFKVSSTRIRKEIAEGALDIARAMLGRPYSILGTVTRGRGLGRRIGFPTANVRHAHEVLPPKGVYAAAARIGDSHTLHPGVLNLGLRPTVEPDATTPTLEIHLFTPPAFDLEGADIEIEFRVFLRAERRFDSLDELQAQIRRDVGEARRAFDR